MAVDDVIIIFTYLVQELLPGLKSRSGNRAQDQAGGLGNVPGEGFKVTMGIQDPLPPPSETSRISLTQCSGIHWPGWSMYLSYITTLGS